ncbi:MAG: glycosyltransferase [Candidatus Hydrogenedentes bacterium]|nr:glycosyltransferase [Candidatus Hydrogenedentota bacterium]
MKVTLLSVLHTPYDKRVYHKVAMSLVKAGCAVTSICPSAEPLPETRDGVRFMFIPEAASKKQRLLSLARLVRLGRRVPTDVYIAPEPESWVAALILKAFTGGRVILDMHEHIPTEFSKFFPGPLRGCVEWGTVRFMRLFARNTDHIILTRNSFEPLWQGVKTPRSVVINTNHLQPQCAEVPQALRDRLAGKRVILHQGLFGDVRGSWQLLEAVKLLVPAYPDLYCIVLGDYVYGDVGAYRDAIAKAGLAEHLVLEGTVPFEAVPAYIAVSEVGLILFQPGLLNHTLAMPHKLFDYMREGVPVVAPDFAVEVAAIMNEADCGALVDVTNPRAIADAIAALLNDPARARELGARGRRLIESKYHWEADEIRLIAAVRSVVEAR